MSTKPTGIMVQGDLQQQYEQVLASINGVVWEADPATLQFTFVSQQAERLLGYPLEQWRTPGFWVDHLHPDDRTWVWEAYRQISHAQPNQSYEYRMLAADGRIAWLRDVVSVVAEGDVHPKLRGVTLDITERKQAEAERQAHLWFLESIDKVNRAIQGTNDLAQMMIDVLDTLLAIFKCDRAWLVYPCDPDAALWQVPMERTRPEYPGVLPVGVELPLDPVGASVFRILRAASGPVKFGPATEHPVPDVMRQVFSVQSFIALAVYPKVGKPWSFGLHQCSYARTWTREEEQLFQEIGRRVGDALTSLLAYRNLQESELRYRSIFELTNDYAYEGRVEPDNRIIIDWLAPSAQHLIEYAEEEIRTPNFWQKLIHPEDIPIFAAHNQRVLAGQADTVEGRMLIKPGEVRWLRNSAFPVWDAGHSRVVRIFGGACDITERKRAEEDLRASETRFRTFVDHATDAFYLHDSQGIILDVNQQACEHLGYSREELIGMFPLEFDIDALPEKMDQITARLEASEIITFDTRHRRKNGTVFPVEVRIRPFMANGRRFGVSLVRDITERKRAQEALALFRSLIDRANDTIEVIDPETGRFLDVNEQACLIHGYTREEYLALTVAEINPVVAIQSWEEVLRELRRVGSLVRESQHRRKDGSIFPVEVNVNYIHLDRDYVLAVVRDITERKRTEAALKQSEERYRVLFEDNPSMYFMLEADGTVSSVNRFGATQLGYTVAELTGHPVLNVFYPEDKAAALEAVRQCIEHPGEVFHWSLRKVRKDGSMLWVEETARAMHREDGSPIVLIVCEDITERKETEQALVESHNLLTTVVEGTSDAVFVKDLQGRYLMINAAGARFLGKPMEEVIGKDDREFFTLDTAHTMMARDRQVIASEESQVFEGIATAAGVTRTYLATQSVFRDAQGQVIGLIGLSRDITDLKRLEDELRHAQKMEAVGRLAGGIAHDFNNLLTVINGYSSLLLSRLHEDDPNRKRLAEIQKAGERAANLTRQLLAFSRKQVLQPQIVSVNVLLGELLKLLQRLIGEDIELILSPEVSLGLAKVDPGQFEQAIVNLAVNARDAMPHGGRLTIETRNIDLDGEYAERYPEVKPGRYIQVIVSDSGQGMDATTQSHIFEPFFTTKEMGKGTGLGLAMVYGFVKQSGGHIEVFSEVGSGATFKVYLPRAAESTPLIKLPQVPTTLPSGTETVLLVEDEEAVRTLARLVLQSGGYTVLEARDGQEAIAVAQQHPGPIHILVTDLVMPRLGGHPLANRLMQARPPMRVLFTSGYTDEAVLGHEGLEAGIGFLQKPFGPADLAHKVRALLNAEGVSTV